MPLRWTFDTWYGCWELDRETPPLTVADPCIWHSSGTNLSRGQSATVAGAPTDYARVCLAAPPPASATLPLFSSLARATRQEGSRLCAFQVAKPVPIWLVSCPMAACAYRALQYVSSAPDPTGLPGGDLSRPSEERLPEFLVLRFEPA